MSLKERIFNRKAGKQPEREVVFPNFDTVRSVLVLFESDMEEQNEIIKSIANELRKEDKDVVLWGYCEKKEIQTPAMSHLRILGTRDFNILGAPKDEIIAELQKREYDLLIDLTQHQSRPLRSLALYARATFKSGMNLGQGIHDFLINTDPQATPQFLFEQIVKYLKMIQPK